MVRLRLLASNLLQADFYPGGRLSAVGLQLAIITQEVQDKTTAEWVGQINA
jgi:hypothetical protein